MIDVGRLNKRIAFFEYSEKSNELEQAVYELKKVRTMWASVEPVSGKEYYNANKTENQVAYIVYTRYVKGITPNMIIKFGTRKFYISAVMNIMERNEMLKIMCFEKEGDTFE